EMKITQVNEHAERLAGNEDDVLTVERIDKQQHSATNREQPKRHGNDAVASPLGSDPLDQEAHREQRLGSKPEQHPPIEPGDENVGQIRADRVRHLNEQACPPPIEESVFYGE